MSLINRHKVNEYMHFNIYYTYYNKYIRYLNQWEHYQQKKKREHFIFLDK